MKKLISIGFVLASLSAMAAPFKAVSFLPGPFLFQTNNATVNYGATNVQFVDASLNLKYSNNTNAIVPTIYFGTNQQPVIPATFNTPGATIAYTNSITTNSFTVGNAWFDVGLWSDANGDASPQNISITAACDSAAGTNLITAVFVKEPDGINPTSSTTEAVDKLTLILAVSGITNNTASTNVTTGTSGFATGTGGVRLLKITTANSTTNSFVIIKGLSANGYIP